MHTNDRRIGWNHRETCPNRFASRRAAGNATFGLDVGRGDDKDDTIADRSGGIDSMIDDPTRSDLLVLLGTPGS